MQIENEIRVKTTLHNFKKPSPIFETFFCSVNSRFLKWNLFFFLIYLEISNLYGKKIVNFSVLFSNDFHIMQQNKCFKSDIYFRVTYDRLNYLLWLCWSQILSKNVFSYVRPYGRPGPSSSSLAPKIYNLKFIAI